MWNSAENLSVRSSSFREDGDDEEALRWAAIERLPTYNRVRKGIFTNIVGDSKEVDVNKLEVEELKLVLDRLLNSAEEDWKRFFDRMRRRFDAVDLEFPKIEVRFQNLNVETYVHVGSRALPTITNFIVNMTEGFLRQLRIYKGKRRKLTILDNVSGIIRPSRMTLLLGPPSSGKTTLMLALAGRLGHHLQTSGKITYNGHSLKEFVPQRTSAYVSQQDWHIAEMTVRETLDLSARCQGVGFKYGNLLELLSSIFSEVLKFNLTKILGLDVCANTMVGDQMLRGISGGQKKRLTTGELLVGPSRVLIMDEISNGLDSSTTYQIIKYLRHSTRALDGTTVISLLQPAPETYDLFDDIILICEGHIVYQGPRNTALDFFAFMGFQCPQRKNVADFLQEVVSEKDQEQYWSVPDRPYSYIPVKKFAEAFSSYRVGKNLVEELGVPFDRQYNHPAALSTSHYGVKRRELLKTSFNWQLLLMQRNSFIYVFKFIQLLFVAIITMSVFFRTTLHHRTVDDGGLYLGELYFSMVILLFNGFTEVSMLVAKLPVIYKHRDLHFYPSWVYTLPSWILSIPTSLIESGIWVAVTYYVVGLDPNIVRFFKQFLLYFFLHQASIGLFRLMGSLGRNMIVANTFGSFALLIVMALGGYVISKDSIPSWWIWGFWISPLMYAQDAASVNEFLGHAWDKRGNQSTKTLGEMVLKARSIFPQTYWYWIGLAALLGYTILFNALFTFFLSYLNPLGRSQAVVSKEELKDKDGKKNSESVVIQLREFLEHSGSFTGKNIYQRGMVLPFQPLSMAFSNINYYVDVPPELKQQGVAEDRLQLLVDVTGAFRPGVLTALVGVSGAGKTTLMDVLAGRKTGGVIEGSIHISGYLKSQETFARISGYCEQNDIHSPCLTVLESLLFSAWLRLPSDIFVEEVMELVELIPLKGALVGLPGVDGLSTEQRKRLTIAVELVANPSIVFMDEPTSGLDARSAAILLFMKRGGQLIYAGVRKIKSGYNPATWMLEVTSPAEETGLGVDFAEVYRRSKLFQRNRDLVERLKKPRNDSKELHFPTKYSRSYADQFATCLWKQYLSYWRNPQYTAVRFFYTCIISLMLGTICWRFGSKQESQQDLFNAMGSMYLAVLFIGITNATAVQPVVSVERFVSYRERAAAIEFPYVLAQALIYSTIFYSLAAFEWSTWKFIWYIYFMYLTMLYFTFYGMMTTAMTPNHNVAAIIAAPFYMLWNLFSGFMIPHKRIPIWWRWYYWANPIAWTLYGLVVSQYGDLTKPVKLSDGVTSLPIKELVNDVFGYKHEFLGVAVFMVFAFCFLFAVIFAFAIKSFVFQKR
ncbi:AAA+ ATPase domain-containing protein [Cynara cardunculus var. scolymus]|uniref:AAA+ ATPase domain-containing protein n=1 Tax=Cynara cardunculus var. scolymus TaxID=59895 RepID=A0A103XN64_CYNCS|nr:AAA+ ATPase domain-containing protein [Cynara cardunculus var. scolymus]